MFGTIICNRKELTEEENARYQSTYCGMCRAIKTRYGQVERLTVNYDMTFLAILLNGLYEENEIYSIFEQKDDKVIMEEYSLTALKQMYISIYKRKPTSSYTKERIISTLRNRMHTMNRTEAFMRLAEEREKKKDK